MSGPPGYEMPLLPAALPGGRAAFSTARGAAWDPRAGTICFGSVERAWLPECDDGVAPAGTAIAAVTSAAAPAVSARLRGRRRLVRAGMGPPSDNEVGGRPFCLVRPQRATTRLSPGLPHSDRLVTLASRRGKSRLATREVRVCPATAAAPSSAS